MWAPPRCQTLRPGLVQQVNPVTAELQLPRRQHAVQDPVRTPAEVVSSCKQLHWLEMVLRSIHNLHVSQTIDRPYRAINRTCWAQQVTLRLHLTPDTTALLFDSFAVLFAVKAFCAKAILHHRQHWDGGGLVVLWKSARLILIVSEAC